MYNSTTIQHNGIAMVCVVCVDNLAECAPVEGDRPQSREGRRAAQGAPGLLWRQEAQAGEDHSGATLVHLGVGYTPRRSVGRQVSKES